MEDDYDSEFSYAGPVPPVLQGAGRDRVALLGSMSRTLNPTVSIGWAVAPPRLVGGVRAGRGLPVSPPALNQLALAHSVDPGAYDRRVCVPTRQRFRARRSALSSTLARELPGYRVRRQQAGLDLLLDLPAGTDTAAILAAAQQRPIQAGHPRRAAAGPRPGRARPAARLRQPERPAPWTRQSRCWLTSSVTAGDPLRVIHGADR